MFRSLFYFLLLAYSKWCDFAGYKVMPGFSEGYRSFDLRSSIYIPAGPVIGLLLPQTHPKSMSGKVEMPDGLILSLIMNKPKHSARQHEDIRKGILKKLANGGIRQSELVRMFSDASTEVVFGIMTKMQQRGQILVEDKDGWNFIILPPRVEKPPRKEIKIEPILPEVQPILPVIEPLERASGVFARDSPERLILSMLGEGARMRVSLIRLVAGQMDSDEANKLLDRMIKSGIISETRGGRMSLISKHDHV